MAIVDQGGLLPIILRLVGIVIALGVGFVVFQLAMIWWSGKSLGFYWP